MASALLLTGFSSILLNSGRVPIRLLQDSFYQKDEQGNSVAAVKNEDGSLSVQYTTSKGETTNLTLQRDENVVRALDAEGNLVAQYEIDK